MRFSTLMSLATAITAITAFHIPDGQANGVYEVTYGSDGTEQHTFLTSGSTAKTKRTISMRGGSLQKRVIEQIQCFPGEGILNTENNGIAATYLANQCGALTSVGAGRDFYSIYGDTVAYFCNLKNVAQTCTANDAWNSFLIINNNCGRSAPGYVLYSDPNGRDQYGYENWNSPPGKNFCNRGINGK